MTRQSRQGNTSQRKTSSVRQNKPASATPSKAPLQRAILQMQRTLGNQATTRALASQLKAAQMMGGPEEEELQLKADPAQRSTDEEELQMKPAKPVQRKSGGANKMPEHVQAKMETAFNTDFSDVNIHVGSQASDVGALAYAQGDDIHFAQGKFDPESRSGQELLGHELAHVVQQRAGRVQPTTEANGLPINDDPKLEQEADNLGRKAASLELE